MALESSLWQWLSKARVELGDRLQMERVENLLGAGYPDVDGFLRLPTHHCELATLGAGLPTAGAFKLELKSSERPARESTPVRFKLRGREAQIAFMRRRWDLEGNAFFLCQVGSSSERRLYLVPGNLGDWLKAGVVESELAIACLKTGVWTGARISQTDILTRAIQCRVRSFLFPN